MYYWLNPNIRFYPPVESKSDWILANLESKKDIRVSSSICLLLSTFLNGSDINSVKNRFARKLHKPDLGLSEIVPWLVENTFLLTSATEQEEREKMISLWHQHGWFEALDYHLLTYAYPFENYSIDGSANDGNRMDEYRSLDIEPPRTKKYDDIEVEHLAPTTFDACAAIKVSTYSVLNENQPSAEWNYQHLLQLASITFGKLRSRKVKSSSSVDDLIRKTSPSGGCRHPSEGYVFCLSVQCIDAGVYHFCTETNTLDKISTLPSTIDLNIYFDGLYRAPFEPMAFVVMTSVFERNMFRYREPRTFRTPLMDVGHLIGTLEYSAHSLGIKTYAHHGIDDQKIESMLSIRELDEAVIYGVAIG